MAILTYLSIYIGLTLTLVLIVDTTKLSSLPGLE